MKSYHGVPTRTGRGGYIVEVIEGPAQFRPLNPRHDLWNHSPDGFAWGYGGSGPAQLALALAADVLGDDQEAVRLHQALKWAMVAHFPQGQPWHRSEAQIRNALAKLGAAHV